jgi:hypothetical protein
MAGMAKGETSPPLTPAALARRVSTKAVLCRNRLAHRPAMC